MFDDLTLEGIAVLVGVFLLLIGIIAKKKQSDKNEMLDNNYNNDPNSNNIGSKENKYNSIFNDKK